MQEKLIFLPSQLPVEYQYTFNEPFEEFNVTAHDGAQLNALHFKTEDPKGVILYFHGNAGDLSRWGELTAYFTKYRYDVIVMDYRTYGKSSGKLSENSLYKDAQLFYEHTANLFPEDQIVIYGRSLGTTFATYVASKNEPRDLILETPFYSLTEVAQQRFPFLPVKWLLRYHFPTHQFVKDLECPVTIFHGTADRVVSYQFGKKLSTVIPDEKLTFITVPDGRHNNLSEFEAYHKQIEKLLH